MTANELIRKLRKEVAKLTSGDIPIKIDGTRILGAEVKLDEDESGLFIDIQQFYF